MVTEFRWNRVGYPVAGAIVMSSSDFANSRTRKARTRTTQAAQRGGEMDAKGIRKNADTDKLEHELGWNGLESFGRTGEITQLWLSLIVLLLYST